MTSVTLKVADSQPSGLFRGEMSGPHSELFAVLYGFPHRRREHHRSVLDGEKLRVGLDGVRTTAGQNDNQDQVTHLYSRRLNLKGYRFHGIPALLSSSWGAVVLPLPVVARREVLSSHA